jgi:hypothetical protein
MAGMKRDPVPEPPSRIRARYAALLASGLRPVTALAVSVAVVVGRTVPVLAVVALCGWIIDILGARTVGIAFAATAFVLLWIGMLAVVIGCTVSDAAQFWRRWVRGQEFTVLYARGWSFYRTVWAGIRGTNRLYQRRRGYRQLDL